MPSTTRRLSPNGCPRRTSFEGNSGAIRSHCSSVNTRYREPVVLTQPDCREPQHEYGSHELDRRPVAGAGVIGCHAVGGYCGVVTGIAIGRVSRET